LVRFQWQACFARSRVRFPRPPRASVAVSLENVMHPPHNLVSSETVLQHKLHDTRRPCVSDLSECGRRLQISSNAQKLGMVPGVEHLPAKLDRMAFGKPRLFVNLQIEVIDAGAVQNVAPSVSDTPVGAAGSQQHEGIDIIKAVDRSLILRE